ncbi:17-beta-hydroxysteroid dehydrogenase type 2 [Halichoeres trimaculatus]|uniref:17-beta-hydroxysteroid dehydrogenase type 2 n=1 Tax=Halichoeres trimaculatus TaxID=147232 RepID=UPI003D9E3C12
METRSCVCAGAAALYVLTLLWRIHSDREASGTWFGALCGALCGALGASLYYLAPPAPCAVALLICSFILVCVRRRRETLLQGRRAVLVTGCDSGFGLALVQRLSEEGLTVFAGVLDVDGPGAGLLRERGHEDLQVLQLDVTDGAQVETAHRFISAQVEHTGLWGLVNNAGVLQCPTDAELQPVSWFRRSVEVNFLSAVRMSQLFLPLLRKSRGRLVNVSSMAGEVPMPMFSSYGASKAALSVFSRVLRMELSPWGVHVALIQPAGFRTKIFGGREDLPLNRDHILSALSSEAREDYGTAYVSSLLDLPSKMSQMSPEDLTPVVEDMVHALLSVHPRPLYTPGRMAWLLPFLHRCCPTAVFEPLVWRLFNMVDCRPAGLKTS